MSDIVLKMNPLATFVNEWHFAAADNLSVAAACDDIRIPAKRRWIVLRGVARGSGSVPTTRTSSLRPLLQSFVLKVLVMSTLGWTPMHTHHFQPSAPCILDCIRGKGLHAADTVANIVGDLSSCCSSRCAHVSLSFSRLNFCKSACV